jgi:hypothetical protein
MSRRGVERFAWGSKWDEATDEDEHQRIKNTIISNANIMEHNEEDDDLKLAKASAGLLADLESCLPKLLWKPSRKDGERGRVHSHVRRKDLDYVINLVCVYPSNVNHSRPSSRHHIGRTLPKRATSPRCEAENTLATNCRCLSRVSTQAYHSSE